MSSPGEQISLFFLFPYEVTTGDILFPLKFPHGPQTLAEPPEERSRHPANVADPRSSRLVSVTCACLLSTENDVDPCVETRSERTGTRVGVRLPFWKGDSFVTVSE